MGAAAAFALRPRWAKALALALLWGPVVMLSVIATGNHYVFDVAAGLLVPGLAYGATRVCASPRRVVTIPARQVHRTEPDPVHGVRTEASGVRACGHRMLIQHSLGWLCSERAIESLIRVVLSRTARLSTFAATGLLVAAVAA